ncbi:MAG: thioredoxin fold domain-containing protein [Syntrophales bacterium]|nr:thioredoxin fold domain-containing protein [Syntrophales bacterium]
MKKKQWVYFLIIWLGVIFPPSSMGADIKFPTFGTGEREIIVFTDYFCPPCLKMEDELAPALEKILSTSAWKVTFVDIPGHRETSLFAKYFIFAVQKGKDYRNALLARKTLFDLARRGSKYTGKDIETAFGKEGIKFSYVDPWPVYNEWNRLIDTFKISGTPTCVLVEGKTKKAVFDGSAEIRNRLLPLMAEGSTKGKREK